MDWTWAFDGVNATIPRNAGPECSQYLSWNRQIIESVTVTTICIFVLHWVWKRLHPCFDPTEEHLKVLQQRYYDSHGRGGKGGLPGERHCGYFGSTTPPPLILQSESDKSSILFNNNNNSAEVCNHNDAKDENGHFGVNSGFCVNSSGQGGIPSSGQLPSDGTYQQQQQQHRRVELEGSSSDSAVVVVSGDSYLVGKQVLLVLMTFVLGLELGFKFASRTVIYLLNPCHITTLMQVRRLKKP